MSTLMILQCTGRKATGGQPLPVHDPFAEALGPIRDALLAHHPQPELDSEQLMPAYERYGVGQLYSNMNWPMALQKIADGSLRVIIVSALFGALEFNTPIPDYDLAMSKTKRSWLAGNTLGNAIRSYVLANPDITRIKSFVSPSDYLQAMGNFIPPGVTNLGAHWIRYSRGAEVAIACINPFLAQL